MIDRFFLSHGNEQSEKQKESLKTVCQFVFYCIFLAVSVVAFDKRIHSATAHFLFFLKFISFSHARASFVFPLQNVGQILSKWINLYVGEREINWYLESQS